MPTPYKSLKIIDLYDYLSEHVFTCQASSNPGKLGLEIELIPVYLNSIQNTATPVPFMKNKGFTGYALLPYMKDYSTRTDLMVFKEMQDGSKLFRIQDGGKFTFEPGAQTEFSSDPEESAANIVETTYKLLSGLMVDSLEHEICFISLGLNPWHTVEEIGLQMKKSRYLAMDKYFTAIGPFGRRMMRQTCTIHINLDFGNAYQMPLRWEAANLLAPVMIAIFANSSVVEGEISGFKSFRSFIWQSIDTSRTGFACGCRKNNFLKNPIEEYLSFALSAQVMFIQTSKEISTPVLHPMTFRDWLTHGHPQGYPTLEDWNYHLSTLFPEVRPRGFLEIRCIDAQSICWWFVPATIFTALLYDDNALQSTLELLRPYETQLPELWQRASKWAVHDELLGSLSQSIFQLALDAGSRFSENYLNKDMRRTAVRFYERYAARHRCPADEMLEVLADSGEHLFRPSHYFQVCNEQQQAA